MIRPHTILLCLALILPGCFGVDDQLPPNCEMEEEAPGDPPMVVCQPPTVFTHAEGFPVIVVSETVFNAAAKSNASGGELESVLVSQSRDGRLSLDPQPEWLSALLVGAQPTPGARVGGFAISGRDSVPLRDPDTDEETGSLSLWADPDTLFLHWASPGCRVSVNGAPSEPTTTRSIEAHGAVQIDVARAQGCPWGTYYMENLGPFHLADASQGG